MIWLMHVDFDLMRNLYIMHGACRVGLVVSVSASRTVGREFASRAGHTKDHHKNGTHGTQCVTVGLTVQCDCLKGRVVC